MFSSDTGDQNRKNTLLMFAHKILNWKKFQIIKDLDLKAEDNIFVCPRTHGRDASHSQVPPPKSFVEKKS